MAKYREAEVNDWLFVDEIQDAIYSGGKAIAIISEEFNIPESRLEDWFQGTKLPNATTQCAILNRLEEIVI